ncbi:hypothetical protein [Dryocola clanedunensis]
MKAVDGWKNDNAVPMVINNDHGDCLFLDNKKPSVQQPKLIDFKLLRTASGAGK